MIVLSQRVRQGAIPGESPECGCTTWRGSKWCTGATTDALHSVAVGNAGSFISDRRLDDAWSFDSRRASIDGIPMLHDLAALVAYSTSASASRWADRWTAVSATESASRSSEVSAAPTDMPPAPPDIERCWTTWVNS